MADVWEELAQIVTNPAPDADGAPFRDKITFLLQQPLGSISRENLVQVSSTLKVLQAALSCVPQYFTTPPNSQTKFDVWLLSRFTAMLATPEYTTIHSPMVERFVAILDMIADRRQDGGILLFREIVIHLIDILLDLQTWLLQPQPTAATVAEGSKIDVKGKTPINRPIVDTASTKDNGFTRRRFLDVSSYAAAAAGPDPYEINIETTDQALMFRSNIIHIVGAAYKTMSNTLSDTTMKLWLMISSDLASASAELIEQHTDLLWLLQTCLEIPLAIPMHITIQFSNRVFGALIAVVNHRKLNSDSNRPTPMTPTPNVTVVDDHFAAILPKLMSSSWSGVNMDIVSVASKVVCQLLLPEHVVLLDRNLQIAVLDLYSTVLTSTKSIPSEIMMGYLLQVAAAHSHLKDSVKSLMSKIFAPVPKVLAQSGRKRKSDTLLMSGTKRHKRIAPTDGNKNMIISHDLPSPPADDDSMHIAVRACVEVIIENVKETTLESNEATINVLSVILPSLAHSVLLEDVEKLATHLSALAERYLNFKGFNGRPTFPPNILHVLALSAPLLSSRNASLPIIIALTTPFMASPSEAMSAEFAMSTVAQSIITAGGAVDVEIDLQVKCLSGLAAFSNTPSYLKDLLVEASRYTKGDLSQLAIAVWKCAHIVSGLPLYWWSELSIPKQHDDEIVIQAAAKSIADIICAPYSKREFGSPVDCKVCASISTLAEGLMDFSLLDGFLPYLSNAFNLPIRIAYVQSLERIVAHCKLQDLDLNRWTALTKLLGSGIRTLRLSAGIVVTRILIRLIRLGTVESRAMLMNNVSLLLNDIRKLVSVKGSLVIDTISILLAGLSGLECDEEVLLSPTLKLLADLLTFEDAVVRAVAAEQVRALATRRKQSPWSLMFPHLPKLALRIAQLIKAQPRIGYEACLVFASSEKDFFQKMIPQLLPQLVLANDVDTMTHIAKILDKEVFIMCVNETHHILAHMFLNHSESSVVQRSLDWFLDMLRAGLGDVQITLESLMRSCLLALVAELVVECGDPVEHKKERAIKALTLLHGRVGESSSASTSTHAKGAGKPLPGFLKRHFLAIVAHINMCIGNDAQQVQTLAHRINAVRSLGELVVMVGQDGILDVIPQIFATLQSALETAELRKAALYAWEMFLKTVKPLDAGPILSQAAVALFRDTTLYTPEEMNVAAKAFAKLASSTAAEPYLAALPALPAHPALRRIAETVNAKRESLTLPQRLQALIPAIRHESPAVVVHGLRDLYQVLTRSQCEIQTMIVAEVPDPILATVVRAMLDALAQHASTSKSDVGVLCGECIGAFGAFDPARLEVPPPPIPAWEAEVEDLGDRASCCKLAFSLIQSRLVPAMRAGAGAKEQGQYSFALQEVLRYVGFDKPLVEAAEQQVRATAKFRQSGGIAILPPPAPNTQEAELREKWNHFSPQVQNTLRPLLDTKYTLSKNYTFPAPERPIYRSAPGYREWAREWALDLAQRVLGSEAGKLFKVLTVVIRLSDDGSFITAVLPHLVLNRIVFGGLAGLDEVYQEFTSVLEDQGSDGAESQKEAEKRQISTQTIFSLIDHLTRSLRIRRVKANTEKQLQARRAGRFVSPDELPDTDSSTEQVANFLNRIPQLLMAEASRRASAHARALMHAERHLRAERDRILPPTMPVTAIRQVEADAALRPLYSDLQRAYALVDEPDAMEGLVARMGEPTVQQQLLEHETAGRWTTAQTCYEMIIQESGETLESNLGLINCLKNLGHLETSLTHIEGAMTRNLAWAPALVSSGIEAAWRLGSWTVLERLLEKDHQPTFEVSVGSLLMMARMGEIESFTNQLRQTRESLVAPLVAASMESFRRAYDTTTKLHMLYEIESAVLAASRGTAGGQVVKQLMSEWDSRLTGTVTTLRVREPILNLRRILIYDMGQVVMFQNTAADAGRLWLASAAQARKANIYSAAYAALLHAARLGTPVVHIERAKWLHAEGHVYRAMQELSEVLAKDGPEPSAPPASTAPGAPAAVAARDVVIDQTNEKFIKAKTQLLLTRWMAETTSSTVQDIRGRFKRVTEKQPNWEKGYFYLGRYFSTTFEKEKDDERKKNSSNPLTSNMISYTHHIVKNYGSALTYGVKYIYQTMPKLLTVWLDIGTFITDASVPEADGRYKSFAIINHSVKNLSQQLPAYQFYTAFSQLVSRIGHRNKQVLIVLQRILAAVLMAYPRQALWHLMMVAKSLTKLRSDRVMEVLNHVKSDPSIRNTATKTLYNSLIQDAQRMTEGLLEISQRPVGQRQTTLSFNNDFRNLLKMVPSQMIIPLQSAMTVTLPASAKTLSSHKPFPDNLPHIDGFLDEIDIMTSLQKPRKITMLGSDGRRYMFLCKPKDDLRKDARLCEFNSVINKLLKKDPEARKRNLRIRTYAVMPLNEECGLIEWVEGTTTIRHILQRLYKSKNISYNLYKEIGLVLDRKQPHAMEGFRDQVVTMYPPVLHEWFVESFPEPTAWLAARSAYASSCAVMSMVGVIVGLGDRHGENILLDEQTGEVVHVDFNCLFDKGQTFEKPEKVPFRLTHNMVDAFGVTGVDGAFRKRCEIALRIMRDSNESLRCVLEAVLHDPFVEWSVRKSKGGIDRSEDNPEAIKALETIRNKLLGEVKESNLSIEGHVHDLITAATDQKNLSEMYIGWAAWF
ncbi:hypothetical protein SmJEL517_g03296 [Synchytrium microbalum]|uniref:non-specific serine/threonine protein kinase n=1 Tax=Synchytrium microbalum TaxID=1806994 RepID=A0A507BX43_9FUNG|nr:uncharacterized protein SmJEL517_g03296 [Synchytrium microbalum]TPX33900.1 hypothetical protein SmJEL517_g03296 [Synchytrium microbalum]